MTRKNNGKIISVVHPICCGLDVHKDMVSACIIISEADGEQTFVVEEFSTLINNLILTLGTFVITREDFGIISKLASYK